MVLSYNHVTTQFVLDLCMCAQQLMGRKEGTILIYLTVSLDVDIWDGMYKYTVVQLCTLRSILCISTTPGIQCTCTV